MTCAATDCDKSAIAKGFCAVHYNRWKRYGDPLVLKRRPNAPKADRCSIEGCDRVPKAAGMCGIHYSRLYTHGDALAAVVPKQRRPKDGLCTIDGCGREYFKRGYCATHYDRHSRRGDPLAYKPIAEKRPQGLSLEQVFAFFTPEKPPKPNRCWEWQGKVNRTGYGILTMGTRSVLAHRASYELSVGPVPEGLFVLHSCDNPPCVNPFHLRAGTPADNSMDRQVRLRTPRGKQIWATKLDDDKVREIRRASADGVSGRELAVRYGVHKATISDVLARRTWKHVV